MIKHFKYLSGGLFFLVSLYSFGASPIQGTNGLNCFAILGVAEGSAAAAANLAENDLICAVDGIRFGIKDHPELIEETDSSRFFIEYLRQVPTAVFEVYRDGVPFETTLTLDHGLKDFAVQMISVFLQLGPTHGRAEKLGLQDGDWIISFPEIGDPHLVDTPLSPLEPLRLVVRRGGVNFSLKEQPEN